MIRPEDDIDWTLLDRYAAGEATAEEAALADAWLRSDPARRALLDAMRRPAAAADAWDTDAAWSAVQKRVLQPVEAPASARARAARRWGTPGAVLRVAAVLAVVGGAVVSARALLQRAGPDAAGRVMAATARSESDTVRLGDGSVVILAAESSLEYPRRFGAASRDVVVRGEALFRVTPDPARPFRVRAGHALVVVVGTEFATRTPRDDRTVHVSVAVVEGAVSVRAATNATDDGVVIRRGQVAHVTPAGATSVVAADIDAYVDWIDGRLIFDDAPLAEVLAELRRWYLIEFDADDSLMQRRVAARLRVGSLEAAIDALAVALGAAHQRSNDTITFTLRPSAR